MKEQQLQDKLDEYYNRGIQQGIRMVKDKMLLACKKGTPIEIDGRVYYIRSDLDNLKEIMEKGVQKLRALISNNFGRRKNDPEKDRKALVTYVELNGYKHGEIGKNHLQKVHNGLSDKLSLDQIATELHMSKTNLKRALSIARNLTEPMKRLLDEGIIFIYMNVCYNYKRTCVHIQNGEIVDEG